MFDFGGPLGGLNGDPDCPDEDTFYDNGGYENNYTPFVKDPWYYYKEVKVEKIHETKKAVLVRDEYGKYWIPKKLIHFYDDFAYQLRAFNEDYLEDS